jgi:N-succinyldiaminopimelate aminotransferase
VNPDLSRLEAYPFQKLRQLFAGVTPPAGLPPINLSIGEPKHATPAVVASAMTQHLEGLSQYPATLGSPALRGVIGAWLQSRYALPELDIDRQILPVNGSREALFAFAQAVIN